MTEESPRFQFPQRIKAIMIAREQDEFVVIAGEERLRFDALADDDFELLSQLQRALVELTPTDGEGDVYTSATVPRPHLQSTPTAASPYRASGPAGGTRTSTRTRPLTNKPKKAPVTAKPGTKKERIPFRSNPITPVAQADDHAFEGRWCSIDGCGKMADGTIRGINHCPWHRQAVEDLVARIDSVNRKPTFEEQKLEQLEHDARLEMQAERNAS